MSSCFKQLYAQVMEAGGLFLSLLCGRKLVLHAP